MKHLATKTLALVNLLALLGWGGAAQAQTANLNWPASAFLNDTSAPTLTSKPIVVPRGQISGLSGPVVTIIHPEGKRKVYDPVMLGDQTQIWLGKKQVTTKNLRLKQYLKITGFKDGDVITAERIDILSGVPVPVKPVKKPLPPKPKR